MYFKIGFFSFNEQGHTVFLTLFSPSKHSQPADSCSELMGHFLNPAGPEWTVIRRWPLPLSVAFLN